MRHRIPFLRPVAAAFVLVIASACADTAMPTGPRVLDGEVSASASVTTELQLQAELRAAKHRIERAEAAGEVLADSLEKIWDQRSKGNGRLSFMMCEPDEYEGEAKIIGPEGGELRFGPHKLRIPKNALKERKVITAEAPSSLTVEAQLGPHGLQFDPRYPAELELSYNSCAGLPATLPSKKIVYVDDLYHILEVTWSEDKKDQGLVKANLFHFSGYVVAW